MKNTLAAAAAIAVLGFSGAALAQESGNFYPDNAPVAVHENVRLFNKDRVVTSSTGAGYAAPEAVRPDQIQQHFRWNEDNR